MLELIKAIVAHTVQNQLRIDKDIRTKSVIGILLLLVFIGGLLSPLSSLYVGVLVATLSVGSQIIRGLYDTYNMAMLPILFAWYILVYTGVTTLVRLI